jgi:NAD(P)-dependent dehydrogenase (short-subunit alcohol dehydrogenase family)
VKAAIVTGASRGIGAGLVAGFRGAGYAVVATLRSVDASDDPDLLAVPGDIAERETAERVVDQALGRFGRIDTLVNNTGVFIATDYTLDDYAMATAVNLAGFFHITQRAIRQMAAQGAGHVVNLTAGLVEHADSRSPSALAPLTKGGLDAVTRSPSHFGQSGAPETRQKIRIAGQLDRRQLPLRVGDARSWRRAGTRPAASETTARRPERGSLVGVDQDGCLPTGAGAPVTSGNGPSRTRPRQRP